MQKDKTAGIEEVVERERKPRFRDLLRMWAYVFSSTKVINVIYLGAYILLSLLRPLLALIWGRFIGRAEGLAPGDTLLPALGLLAGYFVINFFVDLISRYVQPNEDIERLDIVQANHQREKLQSRMFKKLSRLSPEYFEVAKINDNIDQVFSFVGNTWGGMNTQLMMQSYIVIAKAVSVISIAASLFIFEPWLCLIVLVAPLPTLWSLTMGQRLRFRFIKDNTKLTRRTRYFQELMLSPAGKELKVLGLHDFIYEKWKTLADEYTLREKAMIRTQTLLQIANYFLLTLANVGGTVFAIVLMTMGRISLGALGAVMSLVSTLVNDTKQLLAGFAQFYSKKNEAGQFFDLMDLPEQEHKGKEGGSFQSLEAKGLRYRYPLTDRQVLNGVDLRIAKGEKVALVGENGMGKTTFVKLVTGTLAPSQGEILWNGMPLEDVNPVSHYHSQSSVTQEPARYQTFTVGDNVYLGDPGERREADIDAALAFSGFSGANKDALLGKDTGGTELSGGQWQKLAIARAAYRNRDFILLDEPTSNLDPLAETEVFQKYLALAQDKTVLFVTHRISVAALADRIIVFSEGRVVQDGSHDDLIAQKGEYARLYHEQAKWYDR